MTGENPERPGAGELFAWNLKPGDPVEPELVEPASQASVEPPSQASVEPPELVEPPTPRPAALPTAPPIGQQVGQPGAGPAPWDQPTQAFDFAAPYVPPVTPLAPWQQPTQMVPTAAAQPAAFDSALEGVTEAFNAHAVTLPVPEGEAAPASPIDSLFGETAFQEYTDAPWPTELPTPAKVDVAAAPRPPRAPLSKNQKILVWVAGGLVALLAIAGLFFAGTRLAPVAEPKPTPTSSATPEPAPTALAAGPVAPGTYRWDELLGTECVDPYVSAWEEEFAVVDCAGAHAGQLLYRGVFDDAADAAYPGVDELQSRVNLLCTAPTIINFAAAGAYSDIQIAASYAATEEDWSAGERSYFCFASRSSGEQLTGSIAAPAS